MWCYHQPPLIQLALAVCQDLSCTGAEVFEGLRMTVISQWYAYFPPPASSATMQRFDLKSKGRALEIIRPLLDNEFVPKPSFRMVDPQGPKYALGETDAGKMVADNIEKLLKVNGLVNEP